MKDEADTKTKEELVAELIELRKRVNELEEQVLKGKQFQDEAMGTGGHIPNIAARCEDLFSTMVHGIVYQSPDGGITDANPAAEQLFGLTLAQMQDSTSMELYWRAVHEDGSDFPVETHPSMVALKTGCEVRDVVMGVHRLQQGDFRWINVQASPQFLPGQCTPYQVCTVLEDITERKRAEKGLRERIDALTRPSYDVENIWIEDLLDLDELQHFQDLLADLWGVAALITRPDGTPITQPSNFTCFCSEFVRRNSKGIENCQRSDAMIGRHNPSGPIIQPCLSAGLCNAGASITVGERHIANWLIGQVRNEAQNKDQIIEYGRELGIDAGEFVEAFLKVPTMSQEKFEQIAHALFAIANQLSTAAYQNILQARFIAERERAEDELRKAHAELEVRVQARTAALSSMNAALMAEVAERKRAEEALRLSEEKYRNIVEYSIEGIFQSTPEGRYVTVNPALARMFGFDSPQEMIDEVENIGEQLWLRIEDRMRAIEKIHDEGNVLGFETEVQKRNGDRFWVSINAKCVRAQDGKVIYYEGFVTDITERKQAERALKESEKKYRQLFDVESDALFLIEMDTLKILDVNTATEVLYGYTREELLSMRSSDVSAEPLATSHAIEQEVDHVSVRMHRRKDGTVFPVEIAGAYFLLDGKRVHLGAVRDISLRLQAEQALRESEQRWQFALEGAGDGVWDWNVETNEVINSRQSKAMLGFDQEEIGDTLDEWYRRVHPDDRSGVDEAIEKHLSGETEIYVSEYRIECKDGTYRWILDRGKVVQRAEDEKPLRMIGTHADIDGLRKAEEERFRMEQRLQQTQKVESLARMAGAIAHNFNNMLGAVIGNLELAQEEAPDGSELQSCVGEALIASQRAAKIGRFMLTYLGQTKGKAEPVDPSEIISEASSLMKPSLPANIQLRVGIPSLGTIIEADGAHLTQIVTNLISNAVEAMGDRQGEIAITLKVLPGSEIFGQRLFPLGWVPKTGTYACISVTDTGCGIEQENMDKIFDPFFSTKFWGRGLGLSLVSGLLRTIDGAISVDSILEQGTTFNVFLPVSKDDVMTYPREESSSASPAEQKGLILVVDDESYIRNMTESMLKRILGYEVVAACEGYEAVEIFRARQEEISLVFLDLSMPGMDGWESLSALRAIRPNIPVILTSGYDESQVCRGEHLEEPQSFLSKPYGAKDLRAAIESVLR